MKDKLFDPARHNEKSPAPGMASVNTHSAEDDEAMTEKMGNTQEETKEELEEAEETDKKDG